MAWESNGLISSIRSALVGQGVETVLTQISARCSRCRKDSIRIFHGSTIYLHEDSALRIRAAPSWVAPHLPAAEDLRRLQEGCRPFAIELRRITTWFCRTARRAPPTETPSRGRDLRPTNCRAPGTFHLAAHLCDGAQAVQVAVIPTQDTSRSSISCARGCPEGCQSVDDEGSDHRRDGARLGRHALEHSSTIRRPTAGRLARRLSAATATDFPSYGHSPAAIIPRPIIRWA